MTKCLLSLVPLVLIITAACGNNNHPAGGSGLIEADEVVVSAETAGQVIQLRVGEGMNVFPGDTLAKIDPSRLQLQLNSALAGNQVAEAALAAARITLEKAQAAEAFARSEKNRVATLLASGTATQRQFDRVEFEWTQAEIAVREGQAHITTAEAELNKIASDIKRIERQLEDCYPTAHRAGTVTETMIDEGELLAPGRPIVRIARLDTLWVKVYLPTADFSHVRLGDVATIYTESGGQKDSGEVVWTSEEAELTPKNVQTKESRSDLVYAVKIRIPNTDGKLKIGMPVFVTLEK